MLKNPVCWVCVIYFLLLLISPASKCLHSEAEKDLDVNYTCVLSHEFILLNISYIHSHKFLFFLIYQSLYKQYKYKHLSWSLGNYCTCLGKSKFLFSALEHDFTPGLVTLCLVYMTYMCSNSSQQLEPALTDIVFSGAELLLKCHHIHLQGFQTYCKSDSGNKILHYAQSHIEDPTIKINKEHLAKRHWWKKTFDFFFFFFDGPFQSAKIKV